MRETGQGEISQKVGDDGTGDRRKEGMMESWQVG